MSDVRHDAEQELPVLAEALLDNHRAVCECDGKTQCQCGERIPAFHHAAHRRQVLSAHGMHAVPASMLRDAVNTLRAFISERLSDLSVDDMDQGMRLHGTVRYLDVVSARFFLNRKTDAVRKDTPDSGVMDLVTAVIEGHRVEELFSWCGTYDITCACGSVMPEDMHANHLLGELLDAGLILSDSRQLLAVAKRMLATVWEWDAYYLDGSGHHEQYRGPITSAVSVVSEMMNYLVR